jgi:hypothetical protein
MSRYCYIVMDININPSCIPRKYESAKYKSKSIEIPKPKENKTPITYYLDTAKMNPKQLDYFKKYAKFDKMTVQDYINWLGVSVENLTGYNKFMWDTHFVHGYPIEQNDIPRKNPRLETKEWAIKEERRRLDNKILDDLKFITR